jgi:hypothetical protein
MDTDTDIDAELEEWRRQADAVASAQEPLSPLIAEARWTSTDIAVQLIADSQAFYADWTALQGQAPYAIYHYTDAEGLNDIIESGRMRASDLLYLAGSRETDYVRELLREQIRRRWNRADALIGEFCERAESMLDPFAWQRSIFAACFCENGDALGQWRAYAGPRGGYAIGLRTAVLGARYSAVALRRVIYDQDKQQALAGALLDRALLLLRQVHGRGADPIALVMEFLGDHMAELVACFKQPAFAEDHEWRLLVVADTSYPGETLSDVRFRRAGGHIVPYVEIDVSPRMGGGASPIAEVICGPLERAELSTRAIQMLLKKRAVSGARVRSSALALR